MEWEPLAIGEPSLDQLILSMCDCHQSSILAQLSCFRLADRQDIDMLLQL